MAFVDTLPHWFLLIVVVVVAWFVIKSLVKFALIVGAVGLLVYLAWTMGWFGRLFGAASLP